MLRALLLSVPLCLAACDKPAAKPAADDSKAAKPREAPTITRECKADADCVQTRRALKGDTQCCRECGREAVNATSYQAFGTWCDDQGMDCPKMRCDWAPLGPPACVEGVCKLGEPLPADDEEPPPAAGDETAPPADETAPPAGGDETAPPAGGDETAPPAVTRECKADTDCEATSQHLEGEDVCCFACGRKPVNAESLEAFDAWCDARTEKARCPKYKCDRPKPAPVKCIEGTCQLRPEE